MTIPIITAYTAALIAVLQVTLMMAVGLNRGKVGIPVGDGGNEALLYKMRRHGNLIENAPIFLILLTFLEISGGSTNVVIGLAVLFVAARLSHAYALSGPGKPQAARGFGAMGTIAGILGAAGMMVWQLSMLG
jgi:uncharacterized membrane protein YecN with MAPEG domain